MPLKPSFYQAHLSMLDSEAKKYVKAVARFMAEPNPFAGNVAIYNLHGGLISLLDHGIILFEQAGQCLLTLPGVYGGWRRKKRKSTRFEYPKAPNRSFTDGSQGSPMMIVRRLRQLLFCGPQSKTGYAPPSASMATTTQERMA